MHLTACHAVSQRVNTQPARNTRPHTRTLAALLRPAPAQSRSAAQASGGRYPCAYTVIASWPSVRHSSRGSRPRAAGTGSAAQTSSHTMFVLGLTGSIGMGKSTVSAMFRDEGVPVWDADAVVHKLYSAGGAAVEPVGAAFPGVVVDGAIDRGALSKHVVGNEAAMKRLEGIVHPLVAADRDAFLQQMRSEGCPLVLLDIPLLFEGGGGRAVGAHAVAVVSALGPGGEAAQRARVLGRPGMTADKLEAILRRQVPDAEKRRLADYVINTSTDLATTRRQVADLVAELRGREGPGAGGADEAWPGAAG